jgi:hypothetical protein
MPRSPKDWLKPIGTIVLAGASTLVWPLVAWRVTGEQRAFFATQEAWRFTTDETFYAASLLGQAFESSGQVLALALSPLVILLLLALRSPARRWGVELRTWMVLYPAYILIATQPTMSVLRY